MKRRRDRDEDVPVFRIAHRHEGAFLNTYLARNDSMKDAQLIGSIRFAVVRVSEQARQDYMAMMSAAVMLFAQVELGVELQEGEQSPAPEHERAGHG